MEKKSKTLKIVLAVLVVGNIFFAWTYVSSRVAVRNLEVATEKQKVNSKILSFTQLFVEKVLGGTKEVSFDDRLALENAVRDLNDKEIFESWQTFTKARDSAEVQKDFYALFRLLLNKISV